MITISRNLKFNIELQVEKRGRDPYGAVENSNAKKKKGDRSLPEIN